MASDPRDNDEPIAGHVGERPDLWGRFLAPFKAYGLPGLCVGGLFFIAIGYQYQSNKTLASAMERQDETLKWAFDQIRSGQEDAREERQSTWRKVTELGTTMAQALVELRGTRKEVATGRAEMKAIERKVEGLEQ